jgi:hypothetical protein
MFNSTFHESNQLLHVNFFQKKIIQEGCLNI